MDPLLKINQSGLSSQPSKWKQDLKAIGTLWSCEDVMIQEKKIAGRPLLDTGEIKIKRDSCAPHRLLPLARQKSKGKQVYFVCVGKAALNLLSTITFLSMSLSE